MAMENTLFIAVIFSNETPISSGFVIFLLKPPFLVDLPACHVWWHRRVWGVLNLPGLRLWTARTKGIPFSFATRIKKIVTLQGFSKHCPHIADHFGMTMCIYTYIHGVYIYIYAQYIYDIIMNQHDQPLASARPQITLPEKKPAIFFPQTEKTIAGLYYYRRKFRSQTSDNMDRWKAEMGRVREEKKKEYQKRASLRRKKIAKR